MQVLELEMLVERAAAELESEGRFAMTRRFVQHGVETLISRKIIADQVQPGDTLTVDCGDGQLTVETGTVLTGQVVDGQ